MGHVGNALFYLINKDCANKVFDLLMPVITKIGSGEGIFVIAAVLLLLKDKRKKRAAIFLFIGLAISYAAVYFLKNWIAKPRPFMALPDVRLMMGPSQGYAFPSNHAVVSFMAAGVLSSFFKKHVTFFSLAILVCFSRVYLGVHYISDCLAGAALGLSIGYALVITAKAKNLF